MTVVDQPRVAADRDPLARRVEIGLGRDRVLVVAELIADIGQKLDQHDPDIGNVAFAPVGHGERQAVEDELRGSSA